MIWVHLLHFWFILEVEKQDKSYQIPPLVPGQTDELGPSSSFLVYTGSERNKTRVIRYHLQYQSKQMIWVHLLHFWFILEVWETRQELSGITSSTSPNRWSGSIFSISGLYWKSEKQDNSYQVSPLVPVQTDDLGPWSPFLVYTGSQRNKTRVIRYHL